METLLTEVEVVINNKFGGFSLDFEMALWLMENRGWKVIHCDHCDEENEASYDLLEYAGNYFSPTKKHDRASFRMNRDLIDCVRALKERHKDDVYPDSYYGHIQSLKIVKVKVMLDIEDYHDGLERVSCWARTE